MSLISYTPAGLKELLYDLANQLEAAYTDSHQIATVEFDLDRQTDGLIIEIKCCNAVPIHNYTELKKESQDQINTNRARSEARDTLILPSLKPIP